MGSRAEQGFSEWKLRAEAEVRGVPVSYKQFQGYRKWLLIPDPEDGGWPPKMVDRLVQIRNLERRARPLWRRAILLHAQGYSMDPGALRRAMLRTLPTIKAPKWKMRRIDAAIRWEAKKLEDPAYNGIVRLESMKSTDDSMDPAKWRGILSRKDINDELFGSHCSTMSYFALGLRHAADRPQPDISSIPHEEVVILLTVRQLAALKGEAT